MKTLALIDADILVYTCAAANSKAGGPLEELHWLLQATVDAWTESAGCEEYLLFHTIGDTFRHHVYPEYKSNRIGKPKPCGLEQAKAWLRDHPKRVSGAGYEADDLIATAATCDSVKGSKVIVSTDKDFAQVPDVPRYNPVKDCTETSTEHEANLFRLQQWLCGDSVDGYGGIYRYGPKTFEKELAGVMLDGWDAMQKWGEAAYSARDYDDEYTYQMLVCATIVHKKLDLPYRVMVGKYVEEMQESAPSSETALAV